ncbi:MAG TPA: helix-turn-helix domain-containing protein [Candidatus Limnocylindria bacterium]|jgi:transposase
MPRRATPIELTPAERTDLERRVRARTSRQQDVLRARIVLRAADGATNLAIAAEVGVARHTVQHWRDRFAADRLPGVQDRPHQPAPRQYGPDIQAQVVVLACQNPADLGWKGQTHWTIKDLARYLGEHPELGLGAPSKSTIHLILQAHDLRLDRL